MNTDRFRLKVAVTLLAVAGTLVARSLGLEVLDLPANQMPPSRAALNQAAAAINEGLPVMVNPETELARVVAHVRMLEYKHRFVTIGFSEVNASVLIAIVAPPTVVNACTNAHTRRGLLNRGVTLRYSYADKGQVPLGSFDVTPMACRHYDPSDRVPVERWRAARLV